MTTQPTQPMTREQYATQLIQTIDEAIQQDDWFLAFDTLDTLKGVSPCLYNNVMRILRPLLNVRQGQGYGGWCW